MIELVTNARFADDFREWAKRRGGVTVHDDGTVSNEDRLGAIGDIAFVLERIGAGDDLLVIAGDNLFDFALGDFVAFARGKGGGQRGRGLRLRRPRAGHALRRRRAGRERPRRRVRGEAVRAAQHAGRDRGLHLSAGARPARRALPRRGQSPGPAGASRSPGSIPASPSTATGFPGAGSTSGTPSSCSRRTTTGASARACRRARPTRRSARPRRLLAGRRAGRRRLAPNHPPPPPAQAGVIRVVRSPAKRLLPGRLRRGCCHASKLHACRGSGKDTSRLAA